MADTFVFKALKHKGIKVLYYGHDLHHLRMMRERESQYDMSEEKILKVEKMERHAIKYSDWAYYPSVVEEYYVKENMGYKNVSTIPPYLYDAKDMPKHNTFEESKDILFVGGAHRPNKDGLIWFLDNIFDKVVAKIPDIKLNILGSSTAPEILERESENVKVWGFVTQENLDELYKSTRLAIAPLRFGAGIKGKVVDSLYHSTPVVTTDIGAEGIDLSYGNLYVAEDEDMYAQQIIDLYTKKEVWESNMAGYEDFIKQMCSFEKAAAIFSEQLDVSEKLNI